MVEATQFTLTALTRDVDLARACYDAGVDRIGVDIERLNKHARQGHMSNARISDHTLQDLAAIRRALPRASLFVRLNPLNQDTEAEVAAAVAFGANVVMLPYFSCASETKRFSSVIDGRARCALLFETKASLCAAEDILHDEGIHEAMAGLNDLSLSFGLRTPFAVFQTDALDRLSGACRARTIPFGFGGLARIDDARLPIPPDLVVAQHARLSSSAAWLSRSFFQGVTSGRDLNSAVRNLRSRIEYWYGASQEALARAHRALVRYTHAADAHS